MNRKRCIQSLLSILFISSSLIACSEGDAGREPQRNIIRFTNPDGAVPVSGSVVLDNLTGLMWLRDDNCIRTNYPSVRQDGLVTYRDALDSIAGLNKGKYPKCDSAYNDWRLPTRKELRSLLGNEESSGNVWANRRALINIRADRYWYSNIYSYFKMEGYVWPVRSDNSKPIEALKSDKK